MYMLYCILMCGYIFNLKSTKHLSRVAYFILILFCWLFFWCWMVELCAFECGCVFKDKLTVFSLSRSPYPFSQRALTCFIYIL